MYSFIGNFRRKCENRICRYRYFPNERNRSGLGPIDRPDSDATNQNRQVFGGRGYVLGSR